MQNLFVKNKEDSRIKRFLDSGLLSNAEATELEKHHKIQLSKKENVMLFLHVWLGKSLLKRCCTFKNSEILSKLYTKTTDQLEQDLNIVRLIKRLRDVKILANQKMNAELKFKIDHSHKNIINLEDSEESFLSSVGSDFFDQIEGKSEKDLTEA